MKSSFLQKNLALIFGLALLLSFHQSSAQSAPLDSTNHKRLKNLIIASGATYTLGMIGLNHLWYSDFEREPFHFFNDNKEWKQIDKAGHFFSTYQLSKVNSSALVWAGLSKNKAQLYGTLSGVIMLTSIEVFDGYSSEYGASWGDALANASGGLLFLGQYKLWQEQRIYPKFSFHQTSFANRRPELLGSNLQEEILKDYNGQTYWLSIDLFKFMKNEHSAFPKWLNISLGYGAENMLFARDHQNIENGLRPFRQYYLGLDFDLSHIKSQSPVIKLLLNAANMIHLPAPTLEFNENGKVKFKPFYF